MIDEEGAMPDQELQPDERRARDAIARRDGGTHDCDASCPVSHVMNGPPLFCDPEVTLRYVAEVMEAKALSALVLLRPDGPSAIVTDRDVLEAIASGCDPDTTWAGDVASTDLVSLSPSDSLAEAVEKMVRHRFHHLPVRDGSQIVAMVSAGDLLRSLCHLEAA